MRSDWEEWQQAKALEEEKNKEGGDTLHDFDDYNDDVHSYFTRTGKNTPMLAAMEKKEGSSEDDNIRI
jgi:hypothetical protein